MDHPPLLDPDRVQEIVLSTEERERYARHITMPEVGVEGQKRLRAASVLCIGLGGLGSPATLYLAAAGVGRIGLVDFARVDRSNLQRQIIHGESDLGRPKLESAVESLREINPDVSIDGYEERLTSQNARSIAEPYDVILDGTDNFATRYLSNDLAVLLKKPNVYGSIFRFEGQCSVFAPHLGGPCYRCLFPDPPDPGTVPSCAEGGVLGVLPGIVGSMQALEAIKLILGVGDPLLGRLVHFDALRFSFREIRLRRDPECALCGDQPDIRELIDYDQFCAGPDRPKNEGETMEEISVETLQMRLRDPDVYLLDVRQQEEYDMCRIPEGVLIPLGEHPDRFGEVPRDKQVYVYCRSGGRSAHAVHFLMEQGYETIANVEGGILSWADRIDPSVPKY